MSETTPADPTQLDRRQALAQIDRAQAQTRNFVAERDKSLTEAAKLHRDRYLARALALAATLGAIAAFAPTIFLTIGGHG